MIEQRYRNLLEIYACISGDDPYAVPLRIYPAPHYTMGGLWVAYHLMSSIRVCSCSVRPTTPNTGPSVSAPAP